MSWSPWGAVAAARAALYRRGLLPRHRLPGATISIGALEMGGTGKTPVTSTIAALLRDGGRRVAILSRGYGRRDRLPRCVSLGDGPLVASSMSGDEPAWYARSLPGVAVAVGARREQAAATLAGRFAADAFVLDDAFQHLRLHRDVDILVVDGDAPFWQGSVPPRGRLREGIGAAARADAFAVIGTRAAECERWLASRLPGRPVFGMAPEYPGAVPFAAWRRGEETIATPESALLFSGIARPERFVAAARRAGIAVGGEEHFRDHHWYSAGDIAELWRAASAAGVTTLLTTEKDAVRLVDGGIEPGDLRVWPMRLRPHAPEQLGAWLERRLSTGRRP